MARVPPLDAQEQKGSRRSAGAVSALVADHDGQQSNLVARMLRSRGLQVAEADRGLQVLSLLRSAPPDLVILETDLPELHGFDVAQKIKASDRFRRIRIIMVSASYRGWRIAEDVRETLQVEDFIEKPFRLNALWHTVERVLEPRGGGRHSLPRRRMAASALKAYRDGIEQARVGDVDGAIDAMREGLRIDPLSAKLHLQLGVLYLKRRGMAYQAIQAFESVIKLEPNSFTALRTLGTLYEEKGFRNQAIDMWERALRCSPDEDIAGQIRTRLHGLI